MPSLNQAPDPNPYKSGIGTRARATAKPKVTPPKQIYLRDIRDLTMHGGIDSAGRLVLLPVFSGLGTKGIRVNDYLDQGEGFWIRGELKQALGWSSWNPRRPNLYHARYPALTASLPLPSPAVIDHVLGGGNTSSSSYDVARSQLSRCMAFPRWRLFRLFGEDISDSRAMVEALLAGESSSPGLLTENFRQILEALQDLHAAIDKAESARQFFVADHYDLRFAFDLTLQCRAVSATCLDAPKWPAYFKSIQDVSSRARAAIAEPGGRLNFTDHGRLERHLSSNAQFAEWAVLADVGAEAMQAFGRSVESGQGQGAIWSHGMSQERDRTAHSTLRMGAIQSARPRSFSLAGAMGLAWRTIVTRAMEQGFYTQSPLQLPELSRAWSQRFQPESAFAALVDRFPTRPLAEGGALIVRTDTSSMAQLNSATDAENCSSFVRIEAAILKPHVAATRAGSRLKKYPNISDRYLCLSSFPQLRSESAGRIVPSLYIDENEQALWPHGRLWQAVDMVRTISAQPRLLLCPDVLANGYLRIPSEKWEEVGLRAGALHEEVESSLTWSQTYDLFLGVSPSPALLASPRKVTLFSDPTATVWPTTVIDGGMAVADVRLAVRFVPVGSDSEFGELASLTSLIRDFAKAAEARGESTDALSDLLSELGEGLRFEARPFFEVEGRKVEEAEWFSAVKTKAGYYRLACGLAVDSAAYLAKTDQFILRKRVYAKFQNLRLGDIWSVQRQVMAESSAGLSPEEYIRQLSIQITPVLKVLDEQALGPMAQNLLARNMSDLVPVLRPYQAAGLAWGFLRLHLGFGICIADEMGLGKTLQAIALLRAVQDPHLPSLVVMPKTLLYNWRRELESYGPGLKFAIHGESAKEVKADVWLVTYPRLRIDQEFLTSQEWNLVVLDEAHAIKNTDTQVAEAANQLKARHRLALTGTPVENRASELWSIINWLNPGYLGKQTDFSAYTTLARSSEQKGALLAPLRESLDPLILRRLKSDPLVALGLPDKIHLDLGCDLSDEQTILYESVIETVLAEDSSELKVFALRAIFLKAILHLKQICIHPDLFYGEQDEDDVIAEIDAATAASTKKIRQIVLKRLQQRSKTSTFDGWLARSGKLSAVRELIDSLRVQSSGILIFTQYLGAAEILRRALTHARHEVIPFIHGGLSSGDRIEMVDEFNENCRIARDGEPCPVMILSIKAGGTGLNLTGADRVIHFDRWWNPAVEDQATDRAHRIGQRRTVFAHTITCQGTIEEAIAKIFVEKRRLAADLLGAAASEDVGELLRNRDGFLDLVDPERMFSRRLVGKQYLS
jgi:hypothetical protein